MTPPTGTVTFLFTDIQGSTKLAQQYPDGFPRLQDRHHEILRAVIQAHQGYVFQIIGDAFCAAFHTAGDAIQAALDGQRALQNEAWGDAVIRVRMGIHTGEAETHNEGYRGYLTLSLVQRVMSAGHGGQILLSNAAQNLVCDNLPPAVTLRDMGEHQLKGLLKPEQLWQLDAPDLRQDFPPLKTLDVIPSNLPTMLNRIIGRTRELAEVKQRLGESRLLTLLGPGGTGKTRLALQVATDLLSDFEDRVYLVDLASSRDTDAALAAIGRTIGVRESSDKPLLVALKEQIHHKKMLSLLDNFEQVTIAASPIAELLRDCPGLKMLVTSREALHVRGENVYPVPPLALPAFESKHPTVEQLVKSEAVQLFVERAQAVKPNFELTNENASAVAEICARLDGLPLAIELATARLSVFSPQALAERLSNRLKLLRGGARDLPARQQTLRDTIDWSYEMLDAREQALFKLLAVFSGATIETVETVSARLKSFDEVDIFEAVSSLADKSLIRQEESGNGETRLRMLETIREYAAARLREDATFNAEARRAHATFFAEFTQSQWSQLTSEKRESALAVMTIELENIQTAWRYWTAEGNLEQLGKFTDSLWMLYDARGWYHATVELTTELLQVLSSTVSTPERARQEIILQTSLARALLATKGYTEEVERAYARALELITNAGETPQLFPVLRGLAAFYVLRMENEKGIQIGERILELAERLDDTDMRVEGHLVVGENLSTLTSVHLGLEHLEKALALYDPKRQRVRRLGLGTNPGVTTLIVSGLFLWMIGFPERARKRADDAIALARKLEHPFSLCYSLFHYGILHLWLGNFQIAQEHARELMNLSAEHDFQIWSAVGSCVRGAAMVGSGAMDAGLALIEPGMAEYRALKTPPVFWPLLLYMQAEAYGRASRPADGMPLINEALRIGMAGQSKTFAPEVLRVKGDLLLALDPNNAEAEQLFQLGVNISQELNIPTYELRSATSLGRLWQTQGKKEQARSVLNTAYSKMTEGFETVDMLNAQALLKELM